MRYDAEYADGPTSTTGGGPTRVRYLIGSDEPDVLHALVDRLNASGEGVVARWIGTSAVVVETTPEIVESLRGEYPGLLVEVDHDLPMPGTVLPPGF